MGYFLHAKTGQYWMQTKKLAPHSKYRARVTSAKRGKGKKGIAAQQQPDQTTAERRASMTWARNYFPRGIYPRKSLSKNVPSTMRLMRIPILWF
jgi:hypothetical protein